MMQTSFEYWIFYVLIAFGFVFSAVYSAVLGIDNYAYESLQTLEMYLFVLLVAVMFWEGIWRPPLPALLMIPLQILLLTVVLQLSVAVGVKLFAWRRI